MNLIESFGKHLTNSDKFLNKHKQLAGKIVLGYGYLHILLALLHLIVFGHLARVAPDMDISVFAIGQIISPAILFFYLGYFFIKVGNRIMRSN